LHDVIPLRFPQAFEGVLNLKKYREALIFVISKADTVICNSECTKKDIIELCAAAQKKVCVVYHGVGEDFYRVTDDKKISEVLAKYRIKRNYIINVSRLDYNKNTTTLIKAFSLFKKDHDVRLVIVGKPGDRQEEVFKTVDKLGLTDNVIYTGYIPGEDLVVLLSAAELFIYPTLYEGFGLPNLEALKCGVPVISSDIAAVREVAADAALLVDPHDPQELSGAMCKVISDRSLRDSLIAKGRERVKLFTWEKTAEKTLEVYKRTVGRS
jgi:glycosyltransferase involved in cell wall biosynthesis